MTVVPLDLLLYAYDHVSITCFLIIVLPNSTTQVTHANNQQAQDISNENLNGI